MLRKILRKIKVRIGGVYGHYVRALYRLTTITNTTIINTTTYIITTTTTCTSITACKQEIFQLFTFEHTTLL